MLSTDLGNQNEKPSVSTLRITVLTRRPMPKGVKNPLWWGVGSRLRDLGLGHGLTQTQISEACGISSQSISAIENHVNAPRIDTIERLATGLGVSPVWLAFGDQGHLRFRQRHPRPALPMDPPLPELGHREFQKAHEGLGARLRQARQLRGLSLRGAGAPARLSGQAVFLLEAGERVPVVETCESLAVALDVSPGWLAFGQGEGPGEAD